jgi:hypothetical protein
MASRTASRKMPFCPQALVEAYVTASRLVLLLPTQNSITRRSDTATATSSAMLGWAPLAPLCCALAIGVAVSAMLVPSPTVPVSHQMRRSWGTHREMKKSS